MKHKINLNFKDPINIAEVSPDGNLLGVYGDCLQAEILDLRSGQVVASLHGHSDFGFSMAWHPKGIMLATGNQDQTCKIWDVRKLSQPQFTNSPDLHCIKTIECEIGSCAHIKFAGNNGDHLVFSETVDFVQIYDVATFSENQKIDVFGDITGFDIFGDSLYLGIKNEGISCLMEY